MNPFKYGQVVRAEDFCPRPKLLKEIRGFIASGQNIVIQGERRIGKTSLIHEAVRSERRTRILYVDLLEIKTTDALCKRLAKAIIASENQDGFIERIFKKLSQLKPSMSIDPLTSQPTISFDPAIRLQPDSIEGLLDVIASIHKRKSVVVVFDEFQDILNLKDCRESLALLRGKIQFQTDIPYIFAGSIRNKMDKIFHDPDSAFFKSAIPLTVGPIDRKIFGSFLQEKFALGKRHIDPIAIQRLFEIAVDISGDIQQLCEALWEITSYKDQITEADIPKAMRLIFARESKGYESVLVLLTGQQLRCLVGLAKLDGVTPQSKAFLRAVDIHLPGSVKKALNRTEKLKIIFQYQGKYRFVNPFFKAWLAYKDF